MAAANTLDTDLADLRANADLWASTPLVLKREMLRDVAHATAHAADRWVEAACEGKGIDPGAPAAGEEWLSGPYALLAALALLERSLGRLDSGLDTLGRVRSRTLPDGRTTVRVFPLLPTDFLLSDHSAEVWLRDGVDLGTARTTAGTAVRTARRGRVALVLGAGNINAIPPLDALSKLVDDSSVVLLKLSPVNAYLEPILRRVFAPFVDRGYLRVVAGGPEVGAYLVDHRDVDTIHITGSRDTHDAIVFGTGEEGQRRKAASDSRISKEITSELGNVGPLIVVPGHWDESTLALQAERIATERLHNVGSNCVASQIVVLPERWRQADLFLDHLRRALRDAPDRPAYYPGSSSRQQRAADTYPHVETHGGDPVAPRTLITGLDPTRDEPAFATEYFGPVLGVVRLPGGDPAGYLDHAVGFCNERLYGDLAAGLVVDPGIGAHARPAVDRALATLRYGTVSVNCWSGAVFAMPGAPWGGAHANDLAHVGSGIGVVHNGLLLERDHVDRTVAWGPFRPWPRPVWFVGNATARTTAERMTRLLGTSSTLERARLGMATACSAMRG